MSSSHSPRRHYRVRRLQMEKRGARGTAASDMVNIVES